MNTYTCLSTVLQSKSLTFAINYVCIQCPIRSDEPANNSMDISTGHMVLAYMEDHLKNKQRLEQEWVALCGYEAEPSSTTVAFKVEQNWLWNFPRGQDM